MGDSITCNTREQSSLANYQQVRTNSLHIEWLVNFDTRKLEGTVTFQAQIKVEGARELVLDTNHLDVSAVSVNGETAAFTLAPAVEPFGRALHVPLADDGAAPAVGTVFAVAVTYSTTEESAALQWLTPAQTAGKVHPYLFTQCQAIHARSMVPCQDTPAVKAPYTAAVTVPRPLACVMSAVADDAASGAAVSEAAGGGARTFRFKQPVPTPSYLIALAVGNIVSRDVGPRSAVWAEPEVVEAAAHEFAETESFVATAESILGPYVWGRYDVICMPPAFPYGGECRTAAAGCGCGGHLRRVLWGRVMWGRFCGRRAACCGCGGAGGLRVHRDRTTTWKQGVRLDAEPSGAGTAPPLFTFPTPLVPESTVPPCSYPSLSPSAPPPAGMENPCMTFVTPTLLCGDRSLADVVVHEAVHSWEGNLVSPVAWNHFWLNEGWTMVRGWLRVAGCGAWLAEFSVELLVELLAGCERASTAVWRLAALLL
jgi:aminopeptidase N